MQLLRKDQPAAFMFGVLMLLGSLFLIVKHNMWEMNHVGLITLIGWAVFIKGAIVILMPQVLDMLKKKTFGDSWYLVGGWVWLIVGAYLSYVGFMA